MIDVVATEEFEEWFLELGASDAAAVDRYVGLLRAKGPTLPHPYSSGIKGSRHGAMRELRVQSGGRPLRVFYAFDPHRDAVLLIGGEKTGDDRFYAVMVPKADAIFDRYLAESGAKPKGR